MKPQALTPVTWYIISYYLAWCSLSCLYTLYLSPVGFFSPVYPCPFIPDFQLCGFCQRLVSTITAVHRPEQSFRQFPKCEGSLPTRENNPEPPFPKVNVSSQVTDWESMFQHGHAESVHPSAALTTAPGLEHLQSLHSKVCQVAPCQASSSADRLHIPGTCTQESCYWLCLNLPQILRISSKVNVG